MAAGPAARTRLSAAAASAAARRTVGQSVANDLLASMVLAVWLYLLAGRGGFWLGRQRDDEVRGRPGPLALGRCRHPGARRGGERRRDASASLLRQDYPGEFTVILVDDQSRDGDRARWRAPRRRRSARPTGSPSLPGDPCRPAGPGSCGPSTRASRRRRWRRIRRITSSSPTPISSTRRMRLTQACRARANPAATCSPR